MNITKVDWKVGTTVSGIFLGILGREGQFGKFSQLAFAETKASILLVNETVALFGVKNSVTPGQYIGIRCTGEVRTDKGQQKMFEFFRIPRKDIKSEAPIIATLLAAARDYKPDVPTINFKVVDEIPILEEEPDPFPDN